MGHHPSPPEAPRRPSGVAIKVLHLLGATEDAGGILTVVRSLQEATERLGCKHTVWVNAAYHETRQPALAYRVTRHLLDEAPSPLPLLFGAIRSLKGLRQLLEAEPHDVLHAHTRGSLPVAVAVATLWRRPLALTLHAYARRVRLYRWAMRRKGVLATLLTPNMARHYGLAVGERGTRVISECCSERFFSAAPVRRRQAEGTGRRIQIIGLGSVIREKNWHLVLEALVQLETEDRRRIEFHHWGPTLDNTGSRACAAELQQMLSQRGLQQQCAFHGLAPDVETVLREADWFILPSTNEPCSVALIEALALGLPAVASASGGNIDIIRPGQAGLLFEPERVDSLSDCLRRIVRGVANPASPSEVRESVRARSASVVAKQYLELYEQLMRLDRGPHLPQDVEKAEGKGTA